LRKKHNEHSKQISPPGIATASLILRKLSAYLRQNSLALALPELGALERTLFTLQWLQSPELRLQN
jgi:TnpA family transposase